MTIPVANLFLLCDRNQIPLLRQIFVEPLPQGAVELTIESDGDEAQKRFADRLPEVLIVTASLEIGDARAVISDLRAQAPRQQVAIVLIGDEPADSHNDKDHDGLGIEGADPHRKRSSERSGAGPIRTALDAIDFASDKFVSRPLSSKSLRFAVGSCIEAILSQRPPRIELTDHEANLATDPASQQAPLPSLAIADESSWRPMNSVTEDPSQGLPPPRETTFVLSEADVRDREPAKRVHLTESSNQSSGLEGLSGTNELDLTARIDGESWQPAQVSSVPVEEPQPGVSRDFARQLRAKMARMADRLFAQPAAVVNAGDSLERTKHASHGINSLAPSIHDDADLTDVPAEPSLPMMMDAEPEPQDGADKLSLPSWSDPAKAGERGPLVAGISDPGMYPVAPEMLPSIRMSSFEAQRLSQTSQASQGSPQRSKIGGSPSLRNAITTTQPAQELHLGVTDAATLIARCHQQQLTGRLLLRHIHSELVVHFEQGRPVFATSNQPLDRMGHMLCREGKISRDQLAQSDKQVGATGRRAGETMVDLGFLKRRELLPAVRRHLEEVLYSAFSWRSGTYDIITDASPSTERIRISRLAASLVVEGVRRKFTHQELDSLGISAAAIIELVDRDKCNVILNALELQPSERAAMNASNATLTLQNLADGSGAELLAIAPVVHAMAILGLATVRQQRTDDAEDEEHDDTSSLYGEADATIDRQRIAARCLLLDDADYFAILGVRRDATAFEIGRSYAQCRRDFAVESLPMEFRRELAEQLHNISSLVEEAYAVLRDEPLRKSYLAHLLDDAP